MTELLSLYISLPIILIMLFLVIFYLGIRTYVKYKRYGFYRSPPFKELYEFSSVDPSTQIATFVPTKEAQEWARKHGKRFNPYRVRVRAKRIFFKEDNTPYIQGVWLSISWLVWSGWGVSVSAYSFWVNIKHSIVYNYSQHSFRLLVLYFSYSYYY